MKRFVIGACLVVLFVSCAKPPQDRIDSLQKRGKDMTELVKELKNQEAKFALFRSYQRTDEIVSALEKGEAIPAQTLFTGTHGTVAIKCVEDDSIVCYCINQGISCVERGK